MFVVENSGPKRERRFTLQKWVVLLWKWFRRSALSTDHTSENQCQDAYHSAEDIQAVESKDGTQPKLPRNKFPLASDPEAWFMLDNIISKTLRKELGRKKYYKRLNESSKIIYRVCKEICGVREENEKPPPKKDRHQRLMQNLRFKKRNLKMANPFRKFWRERRLA